MIRRALLFVLLAAANAGCQDKRKKAPKPTPAASKALMKARPKPPIKPAYQPVIPVEALPRKGRPKTEAEHEERHRDHGPPAFVTRGSGVFSAGGKRWFMGVGHTRGIENRKAAHLLADQSADAAIQKLLETYNARVAAATGKAAGPLKPIARTFVSKADIVDHWIDHDEQRWYSLKRVDAAAYQAAVATAVGSTPDALPPPN